MRAAPRCSATSVVTGSKVCRFHGAGGGAPKGRAHGNWKHGRWTVEAAAQREHFRDLIRQAVALVRQI